MRNLMMTKPEADKKDDSNKVIPFETKKQREQRVAFEKAKQRVLRAAEKLDW